MTVSEIFFTETPKLINLFFEKFEELPEGEYSGFASVDEEHIPEDLNSQEATDKVEQPEEEKGLD